MRAIRQMFGGSWTDQKLNILCEYLVAYTKALKKQPFKLLYIDAFAGTGYREVKGGDESPELGLEELEEAQKFLDGSARISLQLKNPFDQYLFIEKEESKCEKLQVLKEEFPEIAPRIICRASDCNKELREFCEKTSWKDHRAVLFLDPFGMNVEWETLKAVAQTKAIDVWVLFPLGIGVNRLLMKDGDKIPDPWVNKLNSIFGTDEWVSKFYTRVVSADLFEAPQEELRKTGNLKAIAEFYLSRLGSIFPAVADNPRMMHNSRSNPLFMLCFAVSNPSERAQKIALDIAKHLLNKA